MCSLNSQPFLRLLFSQEYLNFQQLPQCPQCRRLHPPFPRLLRITNPYEFLRFVHHPSHLPTYQIATPTTSLVTVHVVTFNPEDPMKYEGG